MSGRRSLWRAVAACCVAATCVLGAGPRQEVARYTAFAIDMTRGAGASSAVEVLVERWSTDAERNQILAVIAEQGPGKLLDLVRRFPRVGSLTTPGSVGLDIRFAERTQTSDGTRVLLLTDRPPQFWEQYSQSRSLDYPFLTIELRLGADQTGEGTMAIAVKIEWDRFSKRLSFERMNDQPVRLQNVRLVQ